MADDTQLTIELIAKIDDLQSGLREAVQSLTDAMSSVKSQLGTAGDEGEHFKEKMESALNAGIFLEYEEIAKQVLETVEKAFENTAGKAMEFSLTTSKFAAMMGTSTEHAAGLEAALNSVGISLQEYEQLAMRMEMRLKTQELEFTRLGVATRDHSGALLQGEDLMQSAIKTMQEYKIGTDQNEFALQVFGRRAEQVYDIMRANKVEQQGFIDDMKALGMSTQDYSRASVEMETALGRLKQMWTDMEIAIGQKLMPLLTDFFRYMRDEGIPALNGVGRAVAFLIEELTWLATTIDKAATVIALPLAEMTDMLVGFATLAYDVFTLKWSSIPKDAKAAWDGMKADWKAALDQMAADTRAYEEVLNTLYGKKKPAEKGDDENAFAKGGKKKFVSEKDYKDGLKLAEERAQNEEKLGLDRIKNEAQNDQVLMALGKQTDLEMFDHATDQENRKYSLQKTFLQKKASLDGDDKVAHQKDLDELQQLEVTHVGALDKIYGNYLEKKQQREREELAYYIQEQGYRLSHGMAEIEQEFKLHLISVDEKADAERKLTHTIYQEELARYDALIETLTKGTKAYEDAMKARGRIVQQEMRAEQQITNRQTSEDQQKWHTLFSSISGGWNSAMNGLIIGTESWSQAVYGVLSSVISGFLNMGEKILEDQAEIWLENEILGKTSAVTTALAQIQADAAAAGAGAYAATAVIPYVGPELAPAAAMAAYTATQSFSGLAFAEKGMQLDEDRLVFAHKDEQILPAHIAKGLTNLISGGQGQPAPEGGGDVHFHGPFVSAIDTQTGMQFMKNQLPSFAKELSRYMSKNPGSRPTY